MNQRRIQYLKDNFAATSEELSMIRPEGHSDTSFYIQLLMLRGLKYEESLFCRAIEEDSGKSESDITKELDYINSNSHIKINLEKYYKFDAYTLDVFNDKDTLVKWIGKLNRFLSLCEKIIQKSEINRLPFSAIEKDLEEAKNLLQEMMSRARKKELFEVIKDIRPDLLEDKAEYDRVTLDMELCISVLGFVPEEYVSYHFWKKSIPERLEFVSDRIRVKVGRLLNSNKGIELLQNKYLTYQALKPLYGRTIRQMDADGGYTAFAKALQESPVLAKKNNFQSLGKEVEIVEATNDADTHALYERIAQNGQYFILEDLIKQHPELKRLNPDSVNTIRIVTFMEREKAVVLDTFLRAGRKDSFVDNGGSGGIFVHVDPAKGITDSHGIDERGFVYESHPDHAYRFYGIRMPLWEKALEIAKKAAQTIPEARYVGWDIACTDDNRWIIVEGNALTMYIGQQGTLDVGKRKDLLETIHYDELIRSKSLLDP